MPENKETMPLYRIYDKVNKKYVSLDEYFVDWNWRVFYMSIWAYKNDQLEDVENQKDYIIERCSWLKDKNKQWIYQNDIATFDYYNLVYSPISNSYIKDIKSLTKHTWIIRYKDWYFIIYEEKTGREFHISYTEECEIISTQHWYDFDFSWLNK